jgi:hypothetical protein
MKKNRIVITLFITVIVLYTGCRKQENGIAQNNIDATTDSISNEISTPALKEEETARETMYTQKRLALFLTFNLIFNYFHI